MTDEVVVGADLAGALGEIAQVLRDERVPEDVVAGFVHLAARLVPGAEAASISALARDGSVTTAAASSPLALRFDQMQYQTGEGPCLTSLFDETTVQVRDLHDEDDRWPAFSARAAEGDLRSVLALQLYAAGSELGALNLFSREPHAFDDDSRRLALLFATHASLLLNAIVRAGHLEQAVATRDVIGMAKGMVMSKHRLDEETAFRVLVRYSRDTNTKLREVAASVVANAGELPG